MSSPRLLVLLAAATTLALAGCSSSSSSTSATPADSITLALTSPFVTVAPGVTTPVSVITSSLRSVGNVNPINVTLSGVPAGITATITQPGTGNFGTLLFTGVVTATPGTYPVTVTATDGTATQTSTLSLTVSVVDALTVSTQASVVVRQDAVPVSVPVTITRSVGNANTVTLSSSANTGLTETFTLQPGTGTAGTVSFATTATSPLAAGTYTVTITAKDSFTPQAVATTTISVTIAPVLTVTNATDTASGISGALQQFMSTGFQPSTYNNDFFAKNPGTTDLAALKPLHIRLQPVVGAMPWLANSATPAATDWSFTGLDATVQPVLTVGDKSPVFQIAKAPLFMDDSSGHFIFNSTNLALLTTYAQNLVKYYNTGGFDVGGKHFQSASSTPIKWWAIFNEPNLNNITPAQYVTMYNTLVPAMLAVDPTLKIVALELSDFTGEPQKILPTLVAAPAAGGITPAPNAFATHFYGTCTQSNTDTKLFGGVAQFVTDVKYFQAQLAKRSDLSGLPIWVTENNVDSDYPVTSGTAQVSSCTGLPYVADVRATSAFFTAYRPLVFAQLGKAGNESLYHFLYEGSAAYGEVNSGSAMKNIAYWTDYWLQRTFPWDGVTTGSMLYKTTTTQATPDVNILSTLNPDGSVSLMVTNYAVASAADDNGSGAARTVVVNLAALGTFTSGTEVDLNATTSPTTGPVSTAITPGATLTLTFAGYGSSMIVLKP